MHTWTPKVCRIMAFYRFWAIIFPTFGGLGRQQKTLQSMLALLPNHSLCSCTKSALQTSATRLLLESRARATEVSILRPSTRRRSFPPRPFGRSETSAFPGGKYWDLGVQANVGT